MDNSLKIQFRNIISSCLGAHKSYKFVLDEEVHMMKCPLQLLEKINLKGGMTYIIEDALNLHHKQYNCSTTSLLAMWYFWFDEFQVALNEMVRSVAFGYNNLGCSLEVNITNEISTEEFKMSEKALWVKKCCDLLLELQVNLLLVSGEIDSDIECFCSAESILVLHSIPWSTLDILSELLGEPPCTYLLDCDSENVFLNLAVETWNLSDQIRSKEEYLRFEVKDGVNKQLLTVVLCYPNYLAVKSLEHQFWHDAFRLHLATKENKLLPGCGKTEEWCYNKLQMQTHKINSEVNAAVALGFKRYFENLANETLQDQAKIRETLDELSSKTQAWKSAMALCLTSLQIDKIILTGVVDGIKELRSENVIGLL